MRRLLTLVACTLLAGALTITSAPAHADVFAPIELVSQGFLPAGGVGVISQADYAHDPALSLGGVYVAFDGSFAGLTGVWRRDLQTGEIRPVAVGRSLLPGDPSACETTAAGMSPCDAELPSISEDGQYVSFTTAAPLARHDDTNRQPDVYVRNMGVEASEAGSESCGAAEAEGGADVLQRCPFTIVSASDGSDEGLAYPPEASGYGSVAAGRSAISASGEEVAFVTTAVSNLAGPGTPAMQVAVRNLWTRETQLVSTRFEPASGEDVPDEPVSADEGSYGAAYAGGAPPTFPFATGGYSLTDAVGASISADGSTVAWLGVDLAQQARFLSGEHPLPLYAEPLWRRIADGSRAPTRRITGGSDPENPACPASGETQLSGTPSLTDPCQGPFATQPGNASGVGVWREPLSAGNSVPQLSADGYEVAFLSNAPLVALGGDFREGEEAARPADVYLADMQPGLSRVQALRPLTELAGGENGNRATNAPVVDLSISAEGTQVAFTTQRTEFPLGIPAFVSAPAAVPGLSELFDADLADETLTRVTHGYEGGASAHPHRETQSNEDPYPIEQDGALSPSFSANGDTLAFSSTASNLVYGDGNTPASTGEGAFDGADVFVVHRDVFASTPAPPQYLSPEPPAPLVAPLWKLDATALSLRNGTVRLYVEVPGAGTLHVSAQGAVVVRASSTRGERSRRTGHAARVRRGRSRVVTRTLASASRAAREAQGELIALTLTLAPGYRALTFAHGGLSADAVLTFSAAGHPQLHHSLPIVFVGVAAHAKRASRGRR